ncbi:hypothetical protein [Chryseobacterium sp. CT-SW4]|uniref:hypothetical protein n=1 Tax=Chryseobacterium sp. SW-1 TaxID=3157343 RepID=UPI003B01EB7E
MEAENYQEKLDELERDFTLYMILSYESTLINDLEESVNITMQQFLGALKNDEPIEEDTVLKTLVEIQEFMFGAFSLTDSFLAIFDGLEYGMNENNEKIFFQSKMLLEKFSQYVVLCQKELAFDEKDPIFDFMYYFYYSEESSDKKAALNLIVDFSQKLVGFILYRDYLFFIKFANRDFIVSPNDNHIPIRIAILNSLNLISELNNTVPNKENIYRIIHAIVGGNEDNVKKYCLSLIGKGSLSQKQITKKHKEFAQRYINEKKL